MEEDRLFITDDGVVVERVTLERRELDSEPVETPGSLSSCGRPMTDTPPPEKS